MPPTSRGDAAAATRTFRGDDRARRAVVWNSCARLRIAPSKLRRQPRLRRFAWRERRPDAPAFGASRVVGAWRAALLEGSDATVARLAGGGYRGYRRGAPLWGPASEPLAACALDVAWPPRPAAELLDDPRASISSFDARHAPSWRCAVAFDGDDDAPLSTAVRTLAAAAALAAIPDGSSSSSAVDRHLVGSPSAVDAPPDVAVLAATLSARTGTLAPARLDELLDELFGVLRRAPKDDRPAMVSDDEEDADSDSGSDDPGGPTEARAPSPWDASAASTACCAHDVLALLALRCGALTSRARRADTVSDESRRRRRG